jgi:hypothetical protein
MKLNTTTLNREFDAHRYILSSVSIGLLFNSKKDLKFKKGARGFAAARSGVRHSSIWGSVVAH